MSVSAGQIVLHKNGAIAWARDNLGRKTYIYQCDSYSASCADKMATLSSSMSGVIPTVVGACYSGPSIRHLTK